MIDHLYKLVEHLAFVIIVLCVGVGSIITIQQWLYIDNIYMENKKSILSKIYVVCELEFVQ